MWVTDLSHSTLRVTAQPVAAGYRMRCQTGGSEVQAGGLTSAGVCGHAAESKLPLLSGGRASVCLGHLSGP